jgi:hypothetical protein
MERTRKAGRSCPSAPLGFSFHFFRAPLASFPYSRCQTAHPPSLKLRRASKQARHRLGVGGQSSSFPRRVTVRGFFASASFASSAPNRGAAERRRRVTGISVALARRDALPPVRREGASRRSSVTIFGNGTGASSSGSAHRNPRRDFAYGQTLASARPIRSRTSQAAVRSEARDATPPLRPRGISGDAPRERGWAHSYLICKMKSTTFCESCAARLPKRSTARLRCCCQISRRPPKLLHGQRKPHRSCGGWFDSTRMPLPPIEVYRAPRLDRDGS